MVCLTPRNFIHRLMVVLHILLVIKTWWILFRCFDGKFDTLYKDLAVGNGNFKLATKLKPEVSVKRIRSAECRAIMSIKEKKRPHPYRTAAATVSAPPVPMPNQHNVRQNNSRPFGPADEGNHHLMTSVTSATSVVIGELSAPFPVQNQVSQGQQGNRINDKYCYTTFLDESNLYGQFELFMSHAKYFDNIDISSVAKGVKYSLRKHIQFWKHIGANEFVINTIKNGYVIPFLQTPTSMSFKNNKLANVHSKFVNEAISEFLNIGCVIETPFQPFVVNPLSVAVQMLAFGLSSAPYLFTKCLRSIVKYWRENGVDIVLYLDDGLGMGKNKQEASECSSFVKTSLLEAGFLINMDKSIFEPVQCLEWLGLVWNSSDFSISISDRRIENTLTSLVDVLNNFPNFTARKLAQVTGKVISMCPVMGNITNLMTRYLHWAIENRVKWDLKLILQCPDCVFNELSFWLNNILRLNRKHLAGYSFPHVVVYSDASNVAAGAYSIGIDSNIFHQMWTLQESLQSLHERIQAIFVGIDVV
ncbi:Hypothetical predicted protein [Mytilus galloprovincialis]|uniref:Reverse transcriptase domain-containing protein n=1 Tax=Mytilus galloprovincialis TaxID=29158 RepID=A0A8B6DV46_MYTGA|nr:Hypothetical predicted protein [Mytilus galloprovincialis]